MLGVALQILQPFLHINFYNHCNFYNLYNFLKLTLDYSASLFIIAIKCLTKQ